MTLDDFRKLTENMPGRTHIARLGVDKSLTFIEARPSKASRGGFSSCTGAGNFFFEDDAGRLNVLIFEDE